MCVYYKKKYIWINDYIINNYTNFTMRLNILNNYSTVYYNFLVSFYLCLNCILPYYDDVIISMQSQAIKLLIDNDKLNMKKIKKIRMIEFIDNLNRSDKIILDNEKDIIIVDYSIYECSDGNTSGNNTEDSSDPDKDPYELSKQKNTHDDNYSIQPDGPAKDIEDINNKISNLSANAENTEINDTDDDSSDNDSQSTIEADTCFELDNDIDESIKYIFQKMEYDKNKKD
jgi:hypothetical protein